MSESERCALVHCGRRFSRGEIAQVCETVELFHRLSLKELVSTICEHLGWYTAAGGLKKDACEKLLRKLEALGLVTVPQPKRRPPKQGRSVEIGPRSAWKPAICCSVETLRPVWLEMVEGGRRRLWNEYVQRYHPLGYRQPFGYRLRYYICCERGRLGCLLISGAAKALRGRDRWIGWTEMQRLQRLAWVVNLSRHLVFPWVEVENLSSHALALLARRIADDWQSRWGYRPVLLETFVDPRHHEGSCYKAAGWEYLGMTSGEGLVRAGHSYRTTPKKIFAKPLCAQFRQVLCSEVPARREAP